MTPEHKAKLQAGGVRFREDMRECVRLGLIVGYPGYLTPGETRITRALKELDHMEKLDQKLLALRADGEQGLRTAAEQFHEIHGHALAYFREVLTADIPFDKDSGEYAKLHNIKLGAASKTLQISQRMAIELYRGQNIDALSRLLEKMHRHPTIEAEPEPQIIGYDEDYR